MMRHDEDDHSRVFNDLCARIFNILRSSPPPPFMPPPPSTRGATTMTTTTTTTTTTASTSTTQQVSPGAFASLLLGISLALMLCGSVTFVIGFILMPWVLGLVMVFHLAGAISNLSGFFFGRSILLYPPPPSPKEIPAWSFW